MAALLIAMFAAWWLSGFALAPLSRMADEARQIDVKALERRLSVRGVDEVTPNAAKQEAHASHRAK